jgi:hypothetical protein
MTLYLKEQAPTQAKQAGLHGAPAAKAVFGQKRTHVARKVFMGGLPV